MLTAATGRPVYLACGPTDLRKSIDALAALGQAVTYCLNQWTPLTNFLRDGRLEIDNNRSLCPGI